MDLSSIVGPILVPTDLAVHMLVRETEHVIVTERQAAEIIKYWVKKGLISNYGSTARGGARYDLKEISAVFRCWNDRFSGIL